jgi:hypothetical protein
MSDDGDSGFEEISCGDEDSSGDNNMDDGNERTIDNGVAEEIKKNYGIRSDSEDEDAFDQDLFDLKVTLDLLSYPASKLNESSQFGMSLRILS